MTFEHLFSYQRWPLVVLFIKCNQKWKINCCLYASVACTRLLLVREKIRYFNKRSMGALKLKFLKLKIMHYDFLNLSSVDETRLKFDKQFNKHCISFKTRSTVTSSATELSLKIKLENIRLKFQE